MGVLKTFYTIHRKTSFMLSFSLFHIERSTFSKLSYLTTNWIIFWTSKVYFLKLWVAMVMYYMSDIVIFMVKFYGTRPPLRVCGSNPHWNLTQTD